MDFAWTEAQDEVYNRILSLRIQRVELVLGPIWTTQFNGETCPAWATHFNGEGFNGEAGCAV